MTAADTAAENTDDINALIGKEFPWLASDHVVAAVTEDRLVMEARSKSLERGPAEGTVSGPAQFRMADLAGYLLIKHRSGADCSVRLRTVSLSCLDAPAPGVLTARATMLRHSKRNAEVRVDICDARDNRICAASLLYSVR
ncbi:MULTISPECIES: PaaI family thioesterase [Streptomyces]|uniref:Acyl-coenzyme A thioesterase PaaI, contains HGG motif n=1 Tax=Streptomyces pini TaxID=1520580 RepID=A0A1I4GYG7_9ACTN|nr:PaaI family thioesterase [Streptomyces pini]SFL34176.1 Acyl-coenzyme A thioesterase PaaI, contains HGG motif [Streptomyces pini]